MRKRRTLRKQHSIESRTFNKANTKGATDSRRHMALRHHSGTLHIHIIYYQYFHHHPSMHVVYTERRGGTGAV
jgi:hypothetical protein